MKAKQLEQSNSPKIGDYKIRLHHYTTHMLNFPVKQFGVNDLSKSIRSKNSTLSYFTISKSYFINYTISFYNTPYILKLYYFTFLLKYYFLIFLYYFFPIITFFSTNDLIPTITFWNKIYIYIYIFRILS